MKKLIAFTAFVSGILLLLLPRYILPACEYEGYAHMHCSDTAVAEYLVGIALMLIGGITYFLKTTNLKLTVVSAIGCLILYSVSYWLPDKIGYCQNPRMPCNYGMVPGIRFIAVVGILLMVVALSGLTKSYRSRGKA
jgi:hypothetical protein